ncbi:hypothetical protein PMIN04_000370 [Paraphaeosphaeria minitans]
MANKNFQEVAYSQQQDLLHLSTTIEIIVILISWLQSGFWVILLPCLRHRPFAAAGVVFWDLRPESGSRNLKRARQSTEPLDVSAIPT